MVARASVAFAPDRVRDSGVATGLLASGSNLRGFGVFHQPNPGRGDADWSGSGASEDMSGIPDVTDGSFEHEVLESELPVLVDFWGDHCPACRQISPILRELAAEHSGALKVVKVHAAENPASSSRYGVRAMPTVLAFVDGAVRGQLVGARPKAAFFELIANAR